MTVGTHRCSLDITRVGGCWPAELELSFGLVPMYDYRCERCETLFEMRQSFSDDTLTLCPSEGGPSACVAPGEGPVKKVFSGVAIAFKGDGFYKNDHGSSASGRRKEQESASESTNGSESAKPSESSSKDSASSKDSVSSSSSSSSDRKATAGDSKSSGTNSTSSSGGSQAKAGATSSSK